MRDGRVDGRRLSTLALAGTPLAGRAVWEGDADSLGGEMPTSLRTQLMTYLRGGTYNDTRVRETLSLAASAQEFQWY